MKQALIYNIQRFSLHDGPGIRTTVFFKGCPLRCQWCANPESQNTQPEMMGNNLVGKLYTTQELLDICLRDLPFYQKSNGGITFSGGEPLLQYEFINEFIILAKKHKLDLAIETSGYQDFDKVSDILKNINTVYYDLKLFDSQKHQEVTGKDNNVIYSNLKKLSKINDSIIVRIPIIPGINDNFTELQSIAQFCLENNIKDIELLPYHRYGVHKYQKLNREYRLHNTNEIDKNKLKQIIDLITKEIVINITLGG